MARPNFFIVGAPRCGTTSLYRMLQGHRQVFMPEHKEPYFFTPDRRRKVRTEEEYLALFAGAGPQHAAIGEASAGYIFTPAALEGLRAFAPDARVVAMLREPVELVRSFHRFLCERGEEDEADLETAWKLQDERAGGRRIPPGCTHPLQLQYGLVASLGRHVRRTLDLFPRERVLLLFLEDLAADPAAVYARVLAFLGLAPDGRTRFSKENPGSLAGGAAGVHGWLVQRLREPRRSHPALDAAIRSPAGKWLHRRLRAALELASTRGTALRPQFRKELVRHFEADVALLQSLSGRDLSHWLRAPRARPEDAGTRPPGT